MGQAPNSLQAPPRNKHGSHPPEARLGVAPIRMDGTSEPVLFLGGFSLLDNRNYGKQQKPFCAKLLPSE